MPFDEKTAINQIAAQERSIAGVRTSFDYAQNPTSLAAQMLPAVIHYIPSFAAEPRGHHNLWRNSLSFTCVLFVLPRETQGGKLNYIENEAIPYGDKWRAKFQDSTVISNLLTNNAAVKFFLVSGNYGAGGELLQYGGIDYIGWIFRWEVVNA